MRNSVGPSSSKVAQMASIFQSPGPLSDCATSAPSVISRKPSDIPREPRGTFPSSNSSNSISQNHSDPVKRAKVSVHRTESHHERFSTARALFERMGSGDNLLEETSRSPSGSRTSSVSQSGHRPGSRSDSESGLSSSRHSQVAVRSRSSSPAERESRSSSVSSSTADYSLRPGLAGLTSPNKQPPDKPERKINAREAISKQRNWFSNFEKSKTSPGPESVDSARRTSVNKENKPSLISGLTEPHSSPLRATPLSPNHQSKTISPKTSDSIEAYMQNWKKTPSSSKSEIW